jgi:hypothetical protein
MIKQLLYEEGYTIAGARKQLARGGRAAAPEPGAAGEGGGRKPGIKKPTRPPAQRLNQVRRELENILTLLERE